MIHLNLLHIILVLSIAIFAFSACETATQAVTSVDILKTISCDTMPSGTESTYLRVVAIQPNPLGPDDFRESVVFMNFSQSMRVNIWNYYLVNSKGERYDLTAGFADKCELKTQVIDRISFLENERDSFQLFYDAGNTLVQTVVYTQTKEGEYQLVK